MTTNGKRFQDLLWEPGLGTVLGMQNTLEAFSEQHQHVTGAYWMGHATFLLGNAIGKKYAMLGKDATCGAQCFHVVKFPQAELSQQGTRTQCTGKF